MAFVYDLAYQCPANPAVYNARAIVDLLLGEHIPPCPSGLYTKSMQVSNHNEYFNEERIDNPVLGDNYPEPFTGTTNIPYYLPDDLTGKIIILDVHGKKIAEYKAEKGENILKIRTQNWAIGVYMYGLQIEGIMYVYKKMVLTEN